MNVIPAALNVADVPMGVLNALFEAPGHSVSTRTLPDMPKRKSAALHALNRLPAIVLLPVTLHAISILDARESHRLRDEFAPNHRSNKHFTLIG